MGGSTSKLKRWMTGSDEEEDNNERAVKRFAGATPFVYTRRSSQYFDEDGDIAHEFYEEARASGRRGKGRPVMRRKYDGLSPLGDVVLDIPCLSGDLPVILYQENAMTSVS